MNYALEFHDSTLAAVEVFGRDLVIRLSPAYLHRSAGMPGVDPGSGWHQDIDLVISQAVARALPSVLPCWLSEGALTVGEASWANVMPLPLTSSGAVSLSAVTVHGETLVVLGSSVESVVRGEPKYVETFAGPDA